MEIKEMEGDGRSTGRTYYFISGSFSSFWQIHLFSEAQVSEINCVFDMQTQLSSLASP